MDKIKSESMANCHEGPPSRSMVEINSGAMWKGKGVWLVDGKRRMRRGQPRQLSVDTDFRLRSTNHCIVC